MESSARATDAASQLLSVGHSNHDWDTFLALLGGAGVSAVADVRSRPFSRRLPQYNRPELEAALRQEGIAYVFLGDLLGGRPDDADLYDLRERSGRLWRVVNYERVRRTPGFCRGLDRLLQGAERYTIAMLCGEKDPLDCHRGLMITPALKEVGVAPLHLRPGGRPETTAQMEERLLRLVYGSERQPDLFASREELLASAYRQMNREKAFALPADADEW
jgi:uncharacterized protein (DUF488 family)